MSIWPRDTRFLLGLPNGEVQVWTLEGNGDNSFSAESPAGMALERWLVDPGPSVKVEVKQKRKEYRLLAFMLPGGTWVENEPHLWTALRAALRILPPRVALVHPDRAAKVAQELAALGFGPIQVSSLEEAEELLELDALASLPPEDRFHLVQTFEKGKLSLPTFARLIHLVATFRKDPETGFGIYRQAKGSDWLRFIPPDIQINLENYSLSRGNLFSASRIVAILHRWKRDPKAGADVARSLLPRLPPGSPERAALLNAGIACLFELWNTGQADQSVLDEALAWGEEALGCYQDETGRAYTLCAMVPVLRALRKESLADEWIREAERLGKPCNPTGRRVRKVEEDRYKEPWVLEEVQGEDPLDVLY